MIVLLVDELLLRMLVCRVGCGGLAQNLDPSTFQMDCRCLLFEDWRS